MYRIVHSTFIHNCCFSSSFSGRPSQGYFPGEDPNDPDVLQDLDLPSASESEGTLVLSPMTEEEEEAPEGQV